MRRDPSLIPLSRQHQHALALSVRIDRACRSREIGLEPWQAEIEAIFGQEIGVHFEAEEKDVFPKARRFGELEELVRDLLGEHERLRARFAQAAARKLDPAGLAAFANELSAHIRKEERQLFERLQKLMSQHELAVMGEALEKSLAAASQACAVSRRAQRART